MSPLSPLPSAYSKSERSSISPPPDICVDNPQIIEPTTKVESSSSSPQLSTPDQRLFSDPPFTDPNFVNIVCRLCNITGHKQANCSSYFCRLCRVKKPGHLSPFCPHRGKFPQNSIQGRFPHFAFRFVPDTKEPSFWSELDRWESQDDKRAKTVEKLLKMHTGHGIDPITVADFITLTGLGYDDAHPIPVKQE
jgi:hypothetical protein